VPLDVHLTNLRPQFEVVTPAADIAGALTRSIDRELRDRLSNLSPIKDEVSENADMVNCLLEDVLLDLKRKTRNTGDYSWHSWQVLPSGSYYDKTKVCYRKCYYTD